MAALDWIIAAVLLASMLIGAWRGLVFEILSLIAWVVAFFIAQWWAADVAVWLPVAELQGALRHAAAFVLVFVAAVFACSFVAWLAKKLIEAIGLRPADRVLGAVFGVLRGLVLLLVITVVAGWTPLREAPWWQQSQVAPAMAQLLQGLRPALPEEFGRHLPS